MDQDSFLNKIGKPLILVNERVRIMILCSYV